MAKAIVHIGLHKTATSSLQALFFNYRPQLERCGVLYPKAGWGMAHHSLAAHWIDLPPEWGIPGGIDAWRKGLAQMAQQDVTVLLSSEEFSRAAPNRVDMGELRELLAAYEQVELWCTLRNQASFIQAIFGQLGRTRALPDPAAFVDAALASRTCDGLFLDYLDLHRHLRSGFAADEIHYVSFEQAVQGAGGIAGHYLGRLHPALPQAVQQKVAVNVSASPLAILLAGRLMPDEPLSDATLERADQLLKSALPAGARTSMLTADEVARIAAACEPANRAFEAQLADEGTTFTMAPVALHPDTVFRDAVDLEALARKA